MGRGGSIYLSCTALVLLSTISSTSAIEDLWTVDIWRGPAPPPNKGPPLSANASRDLALLPYQIIGIVGAYIGTVLVVCTLLLTVGRRLRKRAQSMATQPREMIKPMSKTFDRSPISPESMSRAWYSPRRLREKKSATGSIRSVGSTPMSPGMDSVVSFDNAVIEADRMRRQEEMERLYAAVMAQDERRSQSQPNVAAGTAITTDQPPEYSRRNPPRLITDDPSLRHLQANFSGPVSPATPRSPVRAIYPPGREIPMGPSSPTSPINAHYPPFPASTSVSTSTSELRPTRETRTPSFDSGRTGIPASPRKGRKSLRNLKISGPIRDDNSDGARTPLSPRRIYIDPGIPPEPPTARTIDTMDSATYPPTTPGTARSYGRFPFSNEEDDVEDMDEVRDLPQANPQRFTQASIKPSATGPGTLPLREMNKQYAAQQAQIASNFPLSPGQWNNPNNYVTSAGPVKTTFLEAGRKPGAPRTGNLNSAALFSAGLATPYTPYMPFTPLTPVTPHLTSRAERKQRQKEERKIQGTITEEDAVADEKDMWDSGY